MSKCAIAIPDRLESDDYCRLSLREIEPLYMAGIEITLSPNGLPPEKTPFAKIIFSDYDVSGCTLRDKIDIYRRKYASGLGEYVTYWITDSDFTRCFINN